MMACIPMRLEEWRWRACHHDTCLAVLLQAYEGLRTADKLKEQYVFIPAKVKEVYLAHVLALLAGLKVWTGALI